MKLKHLVRRIVNRTFVSESRLPALEAADREMIALVRGRRITYLTEAKLERLAYICGMARRSGNKGLMLEAGCALGGASILMGMCKPVGSELRVYDVFDMIPPPGEKDGTDVHERYAKIVGGESKGLGGDTYYGYLENLRDRVERNFLEAGVPIGANRVSLIKGLVQDTLQVDAPVFLAHIDVDWYEPVMTCLERIVPRLDADGFIVFDDYLEWSGCRQAVDEFFKDKRADFVFDQRPGNLTVARAGNRWMRAFTT